MSANNNDPNDFYNRIVEGTDYAKKITLEHSSGATLEGVEMHSVDKRTLASVIERLPQAMFEAVEQSENAEEAEEALEEEDMAISAVTEDTVDAFEDLVSQSLVHENLTNTQMEQIVDALSFDKLFELGTEIIELSFEQNGDVKDFHEQA